MHVQGIAGKTSRWQVSVTSFPHPTSKPCCVNVNECAPRVATELEAPAGAEIAPLRHAKASYMVGNFLATLALCGMVAEMLALLLWEMAEITINGERMTTKEEDNLFGRPFEKLGQDRRVGVLLTYGLISVRVRDDLELVRKTRNKYLHLWSQDHRELPNDAVAVFKAAVRVTVAVLGQDIVDGTFVLKPQLLKYLQRHGRVQVSDDSTAPDSSSGDGPAPS